MDDFKSPIYPAATVYAYSWLSSHYRNISEGGVERFNGALDCTVENFLIIPLIATFAQLVANVGGREAEWSH